MKNLVSKRSEVRAAAIFLLEVVPIEELPSEIQEVALRVRCGVLPKEAAMAYMEQVHCKFLMEYIRQNNEIRECMLGHDLI